MCEYMLVSGLLLYIFKATKLTGKAKWMASEKNHSRQTKQGLLTYIPAPTFF